MMNIISSELYKIIKNRITHIIIGFMVLLNMFLLAFLICSKGSGAFASVTGVSYFLTAFEGNIIYILIALLVCSLVAIDYSSGSIRQMVSSGYSRLKIMIGQIIAIIIVISAILMVFTVLGSLIVSIFSGVGDIDIIRLFIVFIGDIVMFGAVVSISYLIAVLVKMGSLSLGISCAFFFGGGLVAQLLSFVTKKSFFMDYWITGLNKQMIDINGAIWPQCKCIGVFVLIAVVSTAIAALKFLNSDVD